MSILIPLLPTCFLAGLFVGAVLSDGPETGATGTFLVLSVILTIVLWTIYLTLRYAGG